MRHRTVIHVGRHLGAIQFTERSDLADFRDSSAMDDIRLQDLCAFRIEQVLEVVPGYKSLTPGERDGAFRCDFTESLRHLAPGRLFDE